RTAVASMCCRDCGKVIAKETSLTGILDFVAGAEARGLDVQRQGAVLLRRMVGSAETNAWVLRWGGGGRPRGRIQKRPPRPLPGRARRRDHAASRPGLNVREQMVAASSEPIRKISDAMASIPDEKPQ